MNEHKNLLIHLGEALERYRAARRAARAEDVSRQSRLHRTWDFVRKYLLPNPGTLILILALVFAVPALARNAAAPSATSVTTIPYQGRLADINGNPVTDRVNMEFRLYDVPTGGTPLWKEFWTGGNAVNVSDGLFSVMLGSIETDLVQTVQGHDTLYLGITIGTDSEMSPRVQLGSVPFSVWSLTVADDSITAEKIAANAVGSDEIADGAVGSSEIADGAVGSDEIADGSVHSNALSLDSGKVCLSSTTDVDLPGNWGGVLIPGMDSSFSLAQPSKVLVWMSGLERFDAPGDLYVIVEVDGHGEVGSSHSALNIWGDLNS